MERINQMEPWLGEEEKKSMIEYLDSGGWLTEFKKTREFEQLIAEYVGCEYACVVSNGTVSLVIALMALGIGKGDEVIVPDYTMIASANAIVLAGAKPVLVDIDQKNLCLDLDQAEKAVTPNTKAVVFVSLNGRHPDMDELKSFARKHNLYIVEDAAQSLGSRYKGIHSGVFGDIGSFSFSVPKIITTGQGGALVTNSKELYGRIKKIKDFGRIKSGVDYHDIFGFNAKFTDLQAVIGIEQMKKLDWRVKRKKDIYSQYRHLLQDINQIRMIDTNLDDCSPWFIDILLQNEDQRDGLAVYLNEKGIGSRPFYPPIHTQPPYHGAKGFFKNSEYVSQRGLWLPSSSSLTDYQVNGVCTEIKKFFYEVR